MRYLKQFGLQRAGTNYLAWLVETNFGDVCVLQGILAWKHGPIAITFDGSTWPAPDGLSMPPMPPDVPDLAAIEACYRAGKLGFLFTVKDPYSWLVSFARYMLRRGEVIDAEVEIQRWNQRNREYLAFDRNGDHPSLLIRYEDLLYGVEPVLERVRSRFGLVPARIPYVDTDRITLAGGDRMKGDEALSGERFDRNYYTERRYLGHLDEAVLGVVRSTVDHALCAELGYEVM